MEDNNSSLSPNNHVHGNATNNPFMQNHPFPHGTSQNYVLNNDSAVQDHTSWNHRLVPQVTPESFVPPRTFHHHQGSGSGNSLPGLEALESAMGGISLGSPFRNSTPSLGQSSGSNGFGPNNFLSQPFYQNSGSNGNCNGSGYVHHYEMLCQPFYQNSGSNGNCNGSGYVHDYEKLSQPFYQNSGSNGNCNGSGYVHHYEKRSLLRERIDAAAADTEQRVQAASYRRIVSDFSNSMSNRYLNHQMSKGISYMPHENGVNGLGNYYDDHSRLNMDHHDYGFLATRGEVLSMAKDESGSRLLQLMINEGSAEVREIILSEVKDHMHELMTHQYGNYLIQKIFKLSSVSDEKKNFIVDSIIQDVNMLRHVCMDNNGTRVIQRMLENIRTLTQMDAVTNVMMQITVPLMKNANGGYVIQQCVKVFPAEYQWKILYVVALNCIDIATNKSGCSFVQKCMDHAHPDAMVPLFGAITYNAALLAEDPYGNYVVNYLVKLEILEVNREIISELRGKYVQLSRNKHASNVVQNLLKYSEEKGAEIIIVELMDSPEFCSVLQDRFGNYVAQTALEISKGNLHKSLLKSILAKYRYLCSHLYGKNVLAFIAKGLKIQF